MMRKKSMSLLALRHAVKHLHDYYTEVLICDSFGGISLF